LEYPGVGWKLVSFGRESAGLLQLPLGVSCCERYDEPSRCIKGWAFFDKRNQPDDLAPSCRL